MGNFYTNFALRGASTDEVVEYLEGSGRAAVVVPETQGWVVACLEETEIQHPLLIEAAAKELSGELSCVLFGVLNHDDDVLAYWLAKDGELVDTYISAPGVLEGRDDPPEGGDAAVLCEVAGRPEASAMVQKILHLEAENSPYAFSALNRHEALVKALGIPTFTVDLGYNTAAMGDVSEELEEEELIEI